MKKTIGLILAVFLVSGVSTSGYCFWDHYHYHGGHYYRDAGWWGLGGFVTGLAVGAYVASLPPSYETVYIDGTPYYYADGYYYQSGPSGYVVVSPPAGQSEQDSPSGGGNVMMFILEILVGVVLLLGIGLLLKKLLLAKA